MHFVGSHVVRLLFGKRPENQQKLFVAREDFKYWTIESERTGALGTDEREMIHGVVDFRGVQAQIGEVIGWPLAMASGDSTGADGPAPCCWSTPGA